MKKSYQCTWCNRSFESNWHSDYPRYCSNKCRQAAYRDSKRKFPLGYQPNISPADKAIETKRQDERLSECAHCGQWVVVNGLQRGHQAYCSNKCRQAAYRIRRDYKAEIRAKYQKGKNPPNSPEEDANRALKCVMLRATYGQQNDEEK